MQKVVLFGATGHAGRAIAKELLARNYTVTAVVRNEQRAKQLLPGAVTLVVADVCNPSSLKGILQNQEIVISALGKSVSINDKSKPSFRDIDVAANSNILAEALQRNVQQFIYVSALHAEKYPQLEYFKVHHEFSELLKQSGLNYTIIKPPAIFSAFIDAMDLAKKGFLSNLGKGDKQTNPIYEGDLAKVIADAIGKHNTVIEAGGKYIYTRKQMNEIMQQEVAPSKKVRTVPMGLIKTMLPLVKVFNRNMYDKLAFYTAVMQEDVIAPQLGEKKFEDYVKEMNKHKL
jgi:uncharacterized protein YbjT (DUF2867 family)